MAKQALGSGIFDDGSATEPSVAFNSSPGNGLYKLAAGTGIGIAVAGVNVGSITASGIAAATVITGTTTNDSAAAGIVGQELITLLATASAVSLTTATAATVITQSLTAGDWELDGIVVYKPAASTSITILAAAISATTNAVPSIIGQPTANEVLIQDASAAFVPGANDLCISIPPMRVSLSGTTNVFLVAKATFSVSTLAAYGMIRARRVR